MSLAKLVKSYSIFSDFISFKKYFASSPSNLAAAARFPFVPASAFKINSFSPHPVLLDTTELPKQVSFFRLRSGQVSLLT